MSLIVIIKNDVSNGCSKKIHNPPTEEISSVNRNRGGDDLKNVLNLYRTYGEGQKGNHYAIIYNYIYLSLHIYDLR